MAISPGTYNFTLQRRADYSLLLQFKDSDNAAIDLTGSTVAAQVWDEKRTKKYADFAITYTDRSAGKVTIALTDEQTERLPKQVYYDVLVVSSGGLRDYYLEGVITVSQGYTTA